VACERQDLYQAIDLLKVCEHDRTGAITAIHDIPVPVYLRGEAYLMLHDATERSGISEFIDHED